MSDNVIQFPRPEPVMEPMPEHLAVAEMMLDAGDQGLVQRSWVHAVACAMTTEYRRGFNEALEQAARVLKGMATNAGDDHAACVLALKLPEQR